MRFLNRAENPPFSIENFPLLNFLTSNKPYPLKRLSLKIVQKSLRRREYCHGSQK